jgi:hypothetical protein
LNTKALPPHVREEFSLGPPGVAARLNVLSSDSRGYLRLSITNAWQKLAKWSLGCDRAGAISTP